MLVSGNISYDHLFGRVPLVDYFDSDEDLEAVFMAARHKVVGVLRAAVHPHTLRCTGSDNYVSGVGPDVHELVSYILKNIRGLYKVFGHRNLPKHSVKLSKSQWDIVLGRLHAEIVTVIIVTMRDDKNLYYMDGDWCFTQSICAEHDHAAREVEQAWQNNRTFHGRPSKQGRRRARQLRIAPDVSVGNFRTAS